MALNTISLPRCGMTFREDSLPDQEEKGVTLVFLDNDEPYIYEVPMSREKAKQYHNFLGKFLRSPEIVMPTDDEIKNAVRGEDGNGSQDTPGRA